MYFVEDGTEKCGFYECRKCNYRFLSMATAARTACPLCEQDIDYEIEESANFANTSDWRI